MSQSLKLESVRIPLLRTVTLKLPKGATIHALALVNDIPAVEFLRDPAERAMEERVLIIHLEGGTDEKDQPEKEPEPGPQIRPLGVFTTKDPAGTWKVFEQLKPGKS